MSTESEALAAFASRAAYDDLSVSARAQLKIRVLDALGCAMGATGGMPVRAIRDQIEELDGRGVCTLVGGGQAAPDRAAFYNGALVRYLDFNDSYLAKGETCHPSDNLSAVLAAAEYTDRSGRDLLTALAVAYQVQCRLSDEAPVRAKGFDHTTQGAYAVAAGVARALGLDAAQTAHAIGICGTAFNALRVTRTGALSHWKGLAYANMAAGCTFAVFLAKRGITGPAEVFEGNKGFKDSIAGPFEIDWKKEDLERVTHTILKKHNAEIHAQSAVDAVLGFRVRGDDVEHIDVEIFDVAYHIIGGGEEGDKIHIRTKEEADHSLPYMVAAAILDGQLMPAQYAPERIVRDDVQSLLRRVVVRPNARYSERFPAEHACKVTVRLKNGRILASEPRDYEGFHTRPMSWETAWKKFRSLAGEHPQIAEAVSNLECIRVRELTRLLT
jgi:2-methylcitrate dehydratase